nr:hypothetical protein BaRGS_034279 [Batillaria attramentaria]
MVMLGLRERAPHLLIVFHVLSVLAHVLGEPFYQRRDHLDQARYLEVHNDNVVKDRNDAEVSTLSVSE